MRKWSTGAMFEDVPSLTPLGFFRIEEAIAHTDGQIRLKPPYILPSTRDLILEDRFAEVALGWNEKALMCTVRYDQPLGPSVFPDATKGDSVELFIDTRDLKNAGSVHRFCHHFVFFPDPELASCEITRLRAEEMRDLASPDDLTVSVTQGRKFYQLDIIIARDALFGYDPVDFPRLGFTYRINRYGGHPQHFAVASHEYAIEKHPALWASIKME